jgi:aryl-alcohol dehydrogenase-like predicted oxidoreductase
VQQMQDSMRLTGIERFDLIQIHNLRDWQVQLETLLEWKQQGKVHYIGTTTSHGRDHEELALALETSPFDFVQLSYNLVNRQSTAPLNRLTAYDVARYWSLWMVSKRQSTGSS